MNMDSTKEEYDKLPPLSLPECVRRTPPSLDVGSTSTYSATNFQYELDSFSATCPNCNQIAINPRGIIFETAHLIDINCTLECINCNLYKIFHIRIYPNDMKISQQTENGWEDIQMTIPKMQYVKIFFLNLWYDVVYFFHLLTFNKFNKEIEDMEDILKIKKLSPDAIIPTYAHKTDSGMDLYAIEEILIPGRNSDDKNWRLVSTGIAIELPEHTEAQIRPRSGLALKNGVAAVIGTIDRGYTGILGVNLINNSLEWFKVEKGMRIAQMVIMPVLHPMVLEVKELSDTDRGEKGFGSTGTK
jgi:dUTP pyrophosphatase